MKMYDRMKRLLNALQDHATITGIQMRGDYMSVDFEDKSGKYMMTVMVVEEEKKDETV